MSKLENLMTDIDYNKEEGHFSLGFFGKYFFGSTMTARIGRYKAEIRSIKKRKCEDALGKHQLWEIRYKSPANKEKKFTARIRQYADFLIFETVNQFSIKRKEKKHLFGHPYLAFPCFEGDDWESGLSVLSFKRQAPFNFPEQWKGKVTDSLREGKNVPLIVMDEQFNTVIVSPLSHLLHGTVSIRHQPGMVLCGLPRAVEEIPEKTICQTLIVYGSGVNATLDRWGSILRKHYGMEPVKRDADVLLTHLSYWTNAGSAYWYKVLKRQSYETTLRTLKEHHQRIGLEFGSYQLDSWWYKREHEGYTAGIVEWEPRAETLRINYNSIFPKLRKMRRLPLFSVDRLSHMQEILNTPIGCHYKQLSNTSVYVEEHADRFLCEEFAVPKSEKEGETLFRELFTHPRWRLCYIIHDWLQWMNDHHSAFSDLVLGPAYFRALDKALCGIEASDNQCGHITLQLCMTQPHMTLNSVTMRSVTSIRSTSDSESFFVEGTKRWRWHLYSARFIEALGKYAFFDNRFSYRSYRHPFSAYSRLEMIWLGLSCGPIGIGDPIGKENMTLLGRVAAVDGRILKPDVPAAPLDKCFLYDPRDSKGRKGVTVCSHSDIKWTSTGFGGGGTVSRRTFYILTFNMHPYGRKTTMEFSLTESGASPGKRYALYDYESGSIEAIGSDMPLHCLMRRRDYFYWIAAPIAGGIAFIGDVSKHVCASDGLIRSVTQGPDHIVVHGRFGGNTPPRWIFFSEHEAVRAKLNGTEQPVIRNGRKILIPGEQTAYSENADYSLTLQF